MRRTASHASTSSINRHILPRFHRSIFLSRTFLSLRTRGRLMWLTAVKHNQQALFHTQVHPSQTTRAARRRAATTWRTKSSTRLRTKSS
jgi:hypothetical protein